MYAKLFNIFYSLTLGLKNQNQKHRNNYIRHLIYKRTVFMHWYCEWNYENKTAYNIWRGLIDILNFYCISIRSLLLICPGIIMNWLSWIVWPSKIAARTLSCRSVFPMHDTCRGWELLVLRSWPCHFQSRMSSANQMTTMGTCFRA